MASNITAVRAFAQRHPFLNYYALVFAISWGGILTLVAPGGIPGEPEDVARLFPFTLAALFAGPSVKDDKEAFDKMQGYLAALRHDG